MDKDIKTYSKIDAIKGKTKKTKRKRVIKKVADDGTKIKIKLKKGGGIKKTVTKKGVKRRVVKRKEILESRWLTQLEMLEIKIKTKEKRKNA